MGLIGFGLMASLGLMKTRKAPRYVEGDANGVSGRFGPNPTRFRGPLGRAHKARPFPFGGVELRHVHTSNQGLGALASAKVGVGSRMWGNLAYWVASAGQDGKIEVGGRVTAARPSEGQIRPQNPSAIRRPFPMTT
jgi:hypothetical protein